MNPRHLLLRAASLDKRAARYIVRGMPGVAAWLMGWAEMLRETARRA